MNRQARTDDRRIHSTHEKPPHPARVQVLRLWASRARANGSGRAAFAFPAFGGAHARKGLTEPNVLG